MPDWRSILEAHGPNVWRTIYRLLDHYADALDCYQETFLAAWKVTQRTPVDNWSALLTCLATRRATDLLRERSRARTRLREIDHVPEPAGIADGPVQDASAKELMERVREGLAQLPDKQADVFWLSCIERQTHRDIAAHMQVTTGEVRVLLHRARTALAKLLDSKPLGER